MSKSYKKTVKKYAEKGFILPKYKKVLIGNVFVIPTTISDKRFKFEQKIKNNIQKKIDVKNKRVSIKQNKQAGVISKAFMRNNITPKFKDSEQRVKFGKNFPEFVLKPVRVQRINWNQKLNDEQNFDRLIAPLLMNYPNGTVQIDVIYKYGRSEGSDADTAENIFRYDAIESKRSIHAIKLEDKSTRTLNSFHRRMNVADIKREFLDLNYGSAESDLEDTKLFLNFNIKFITQAAGGCCSTNNGLKMSIGKGKNKIKIESPHATNNNCFFKCINSQYPNKLIKFGLLQCNELRTQFGIEKNSKISIENAVEIFKFLHDDKTIAIFCQEMENGELTNTFMGGNHESEFKLLLIDSHYSIIKAKWKFCENCFKEYLGTNHKCVLSAVKFLKERKSPEILYAAVPPKNIQLKNNEILYYDIETHRNNDIKEHHAYIVGFAYYDKTGKKSYKTIAGRICMREFYDLLGTDEFSHIKFLNAYNGSRFDHYYLMKEKLFSDGKDKIGEYLINNGRILKLKIKGKNVIDLGQHLTGSLKKNLEDNHCKVLKGDIDHNISTEWEEATLERRNEIEKYLYSDVMGLMELYETVNQPIYDKFQINLCDSMTTSSNAYNIWKNRMLKYDVLLPNRSQEKKIEVLFTEAELW